MYLTSITAATPTAAEPRRWISGTRIRASGSCDDAAFREVDEVAFALPFSFEHEDYVQILTDMATRLGPLLGWSPTVGR